MSNNPLITLFLISYNQEKFISDAVISLLLQTYEPLQIILSDDCSCDQTYSIAVEMVKNYNGPHQILLNRNDTNLGIGGHVNKIMELAEGELIIQADGDDISMPNRVADIVQMWLDSGRKYLSICSEMLMINDAGEYYNKLPKVKPVTFDNVLRPHARWIYGASLAWHKSLFEIFGLLRDDVVSQDKAIGFRSLLIGQGIGCVEKPLVKYRFHSTNITKGSKEIESIQQKIGTFNSYVEDFDKAIAMGYFKDRPDIQKVYQKFTRIQMEFVLRKKIRHSALPKSIITLLACGNKLTIQQKIELFRKRMKGRI